MFVKEEYRACCLFHCTLNSFSIFFLFPRASFDRDMAAETNRRRGLVGGLGTSLGSEIWERRQIVSANKSLVMFAALPCFRPNDCMMMFKLQGLIEKLLVLSAIAVSC